ncbi:MAG TPA: putative quinol monooxygenase [Gaiellaceae bacterium]|nr:putative quinol monooxygenase [Gaiellaceae bacterium]
MGAIEDQVSWITEGAVKDGQRDALEELMAELVASTREEPGTLGYEWYLSDDGGVMHLYERFADSEAAIAHLQGFLATGARQLMGCVDVKRFTVYGNPSDAAKEALAPLGAKHLGLWGGFVR